MVFIVIVLIVFRLVLNYILNSSINAKNVFRVFANNMKF